VEEKKGTQKAICLRVCLDELTIQTVVFANLVFTAHIQIVAELFDINRIIQVLVLEVVHVLASGTIETHDGFAGIGPSDIQRIDCKVKTIRIVNTSVRPHLVETTLPNINSELQLLHIVCNLLAKTIADAHALWVCGLCSRIICTSYMDATIGRWRTITSVKAPCWLLVPENMIFVLTGNICVVRVLVENQTPRMVQATTLQVYSPGRPSVTIVAVDLVTISTDHVKIPIVEYKRPRLPFHCAEFLQKCASRAIVD